MSDKPLTHPAFPDWELHQFNWRQSYPRSSAPVKYKGVTVGMRHDRDRHRDKCEHVTAVSDHPDALSKIKAFYAAVIQAEKARREMESARFDAECKDRACQAKEAADRALGLIA